MLTVHFALSISAVLTDLTVRYSLGDTFDSLKFKRNEEWSVDWIAS
jgi:hypothetical protein